MPHCGNGTEKCALLLNGLYTYTAEWKELYLAIAKKNLYIEAVACNSIGLDWGFDVITRLDNCG